jgi:hypothetical protein
MDEMQSLKLPMPGSFDPWIFRKNGIPIACYLSSAYVAEMECSLNAYSLDACSLDACSLVAILRTLGAVFYQHSTHLETSFSFPLWLHI